MGDQKPAIEKLAKGIEEGRRHQTLMGVTGSGKTFTMAGLIEKAQKPTLVISHNKTLAGQLYGEFKEFFPENAVEYFISYYDYYQPEAYIPSTDTHIDKDASTNLEIDKLRHSATASLAERRDVIIVASVSCIYGLGSPFDYETQMLSIRLGEEKSRDEILKKLVEIQYHRADIDFSRGSFRVRGDVIDIYPSGSENPVRIEMFGDEIEDIREMNAVTGKLLGRRKHIAIYPATHYISTPDKLSSAITQISKDLGERLKWFKENGKFLEAQRLEERTRYDIELINEMGTCKGIENYARYINGLKEGERPYTLIDYFPDDFLTIIDESHVMLPQLRAMYAGDRSRKTTLVDYGFRLPAALDNRPLKFSEFEELVNQVVYVSATPAEYEKEKSGGITCEQIIRPTGLLEPEIDVRPIEGQIDDLIGEINKVAERGERMLITTLTKKMAESLSAFLIDADIKACYMHSDIDAIERMEIIRELRLGKYDVLIGINLLREGLDIPEVSVVAILDADKEGFLRTETSLIQTIGRAARNANGRVILYADGISNAMKNAMDETTRRRKIQQRYNEEHNITPKSIQKDIRESIEATIEVEEEELKKPQEMSKKELSDFTKKIEKEMKQAARDLQFERAAELREILFEYRARL